MKQQLSANKGILMVVIIFVLVMVLYKIFLRPDTALIPDESLATSIGDDILSLRTELEKVNFDSTLFSTPGYLGLIDLTVSIPNLPVGRTNPFEVIGRD